MKSGLYIHIPYCHSKCAYCDFYSTPRRDTLGRMVDALIREWGMRSAELPTPPYTIYVGGGTPSILPIESLQRVIASVGHAAEREEWTIECNPEDVTAAWVDGIRSIGFTRVSMGVQSLVDSELRLIGRRHTARQALDSASRLLDSGLQVSLDLIYGLPKQTFDSWEYSLGRLLELGPHHLSAYLLSYEQGTRLWAMLQAGKVEEASDDCVTAMYRTLCRTTAAAGYKHYEVSNFALAGCRAVHNSRYWSGHPYLGLGPGAHSFDGSARRINPSSITSYLESIEAGHNAYTVDEESQLDRLNDMIITRLRTVEGLSLTEIATAYHEAQANDVLNDAKVHLAAGDLVLNGDRLQIPEHAWLRSDAVMRDLIRV